MSKRIVEERIRQLLALDKNAYDIYSDLATKADDPKLKEKLELLAKEEAVHVRLVKEMLLLLS
jgi:rubrerythrin